MEQIEQLIKDRKFIGLHTDTTPALLDEGPCRLYPKLGDAICSMSIFVHNKATNWSFRDTEPISSLWRQIFPMYSDRFDLFLVQGQKRGLQMDTMLRDNITVAKPEFAELDLDLPKQFCTVQYRAAGADRNLNVRVEDYTHNLPIVNLDELTLDCKSLRRLFSIMARAEFHIGPDSGMAWASAAMGLHTKLITNTKEEFKTGSYKSHITAVDALALNSCVEVFRRD